MSQVYFGGEFHDLNYKKNHTKIEFHNSIRQFSFLLYRLPVIRNAWMNPRIIIVIVNIVIIIIIIK